MYRSRDGVSRRVDSPKTRGSWPPACTWRNCSRTSPFCPNHAGTGETRARDSDDDPRAIRTRDVGPRPAHRSANDTLMNRRTLVPPLPRALPQMRSSLSGEDSGLQLDGGGGGGGGKGGGKRRDENRDVSMLTIVRSRANENRDVRRSTSFTRTA